MSLKTNNKKKSDLTLRPHARIICAVSYFLSKVEHDRVSQVDRQIV